MLLYCAELVDVQDSEFKSLVFRSSRYDDRLKEKVVFAETVGISKECEIFIPNFKSHIGEKILIGINALMTKKKDKIFLLCLTDVLDIASVNI